MLQKVRTLSRSTRTIIPPPPNPTNKMASVCIITPHCPYEIKNFSLILIGLFLVLLPILFDILTIAKRDLEITYHEAIARAACKKLTGKVVQKGGDITVRDMRAKVTKRVETEV